MVTSFMDEGQFLDLLIAHRVSTETGLDAERVMRIYRAGSPWPLVPGCGNVEQEAAAVGVSTLDYFQGLRPLVRMSLEAVPGAPNAQPHPEAVAFAEEIAERTGEPIETVLQVSTGVAVFYVEVARFFAAAQALARAGR